LTFCKKKFQEKLKFLNFISVLSIGKSILSFSFDTAANPFENIFASLLQLILLRLNFYLIICNFSLIIDICFVVRGSSISSLIILSLKNKVYSPVGVSS